MHYLEHEPAAKIMVVSTDIHLRRVAYTIRKVLPDRSLDVIYCRSRRAAISGKEAGGLAQTVALTCSRS
jgi:hypothetical protein